MLSAPAPTTSTRPLLESGSARRSFLSSTSDFRTASRASARDAESPMADAVGWGPVAGDPSNRPPRSLARTMRDTASSIRAIGIAPLRTSADGVGDELLPVVGNHDQVDPGIDRLRAVRLGAARDLFDAVPVGHHETVEAEPLLEHVREQVAVAVRLAPRPVGGGVGPAGIGRHHRLRAALERAIEAGSVDADQVGFRRADIALLLAVERRAVTDPDLGGRKHVVAALEVALQAADDCVGVGAHDRRIGRIAFVSPAPTRILRHRNRRREHPGDPGRPDRPRGGAGRCASATTDRAPRRDRCCAGKASRRGRCCGRGPRRSPRSPGS